MRSVHDAPFGIDFDSARHLARYPSATVDSELVQAGIDKAATDSEAEIVILARTPPVPERIASRTWNRGAAAQIPCPMVEGRPQEDISAPDLADGDIDNGFDRHRVSVVSGARGLGQLHCGVAQRQVRKNKVRAQA